MIVDTPGLVDPEGDAQLVTDIINFLQKSECGGVNGFFLVVKAMDRFVS